MSEQNHHSCKKTCGRQIRQYYKLRGKKLALRTDLFSHYFVEVIWFLYRQTCRRTTSLKHYWNEPLQTKIFQLISRLFPCSATKEKQLLVTFHLS